MKKIVMAAAVLCTVAAVESYAFGIGLQFGGNVQSFNTPGISLLLSPSEQVHGALTWYIGGEGMTLVGSADYWILTKEITTLGPGALNFFVGAGAYAQIALWEDYFGLDVGLRVPVGLDWKPDKFDVYFQVVPAAGLGLLPSLGFDGFHVNVNLGARFWIGS
jgi:hypothetical protein